MQRCYDIYKCEYMDLDLKIETKKNKEHVTQYLSRSVVGTSLANVPLDVILLATMHIILGLTKKKYI